MVDSIALICVATPAPDLFNQGEKPSETERTIWESGLSWEEKWNLAAKLRKAARTPAREAETGLVTAGAGSFTAS